MDWMRFGFVVVCSGTITTVTDYLLTGGWIQKRFSDPEIWRKNYGGVAGMLTALLPFFSCAVFAFTADRMLISGLRPTIKFAFAIWAMGPVPLILANAAFIKLSKPYTACYVLAWFVKMMIFAVLVVRIMRF